MTSRVVVTSFGAVTSLGSDARATWSCLARGERGMRVAPHFAGTPFAAHLTGAVASRPGSPEEPAGRGAAALDFGRRAVTEAVSAARVPFDPSARIAILFGTTMAPRERAADQLASDLRAALPFGDVLTIVVSTACTSSSASVAVARSLLLADMADIVIAGGADELDVRTFAGFHALGLVARELCTPFGSQLGTTLGEGAAFFVLEREVDAAKAGRPAIAVIEGASTSSDAFHPTSPHPSGGGLLRASVAALRDAGVDASDVSWVSAHGTGTAANDAAEVNAIARLFGDRSGAVPVTASKSLVGHALGAAGSVELVLAVMGLDRGAIPPTIGSDVRRAACAINLVTPANAPRPPHDGRVLKLAAAFGGANAAMVIARPVVERSEAPSPERRHAPRAIRIVGRGGLGGPSPELDPMGRAEDLRGRIAPFDFEQLVRGVNPRGLDMTARYLIVAVDRALRTAGVMLGGDASDRAGLYVGQTRASPRSAIEFDESHEERGLERVSGAAFTRKVLNTATGAASRARSLRGPTMTLTTGPGSGLAAIVLAAVQLHEHDDADLIVAGSVDELDDADRDGAGEGAAVVVLAAGESPREGGVRLAGWAIGAGPSIRERALAQAGVEPDASIETFTSPASPGAPAIAGVLALGRAIDAIEAGRLESALVCEHIGLAHTALVIAAGT